MSIVTLDLILPKGFLNTISSRTSIPAVFDGMRGYKTWKDEFIAKENGKLVNKGRVWNDDETVHD